MVKPFCETARNHREQELIPSIKFLTNMVAHCIIKCRRFDESISSIETYSLRELRIELTAKGFDYCFDTAYNVERSLLNNLLRRDSTEY